MTDMMRRGWQRRARQPRCCSGTNYVVDFQRLVDLAEPFGTVGRAATPSFVQGKLKLAQQARDLFSRRDVAQVGARAQRCLIEVVERGQAAWKEFAVNHP